MGVVLVRILVRKVDAPKRTSRWLRQSITEKSRCLVVVLVVDRGGF